MRRGWGGMEVRNSLLWPHPEALALAGSVQLLHPSLAVSVVKIGNTWKGVRKGCCAEPLPSGPLCPQRPQTSSRTQPGKDEHQALQRLPEVTLAGQAV